MILTRLHEEVQPRLNDIRTKLNALDRERQPPKSKSKCNKKCTREEQADLLARFFLATGSILRAHVGLTRLHEGGGHILTE
jgi:hypothetical protein